MPYNLLMDSRRW